MIPSRQLSFGRGFNAHHFAAYFLQRGLSHLHVRRLGATVSAWSVNLRQKHPTPDAAPDAVAQLRERGCLLLPPLLEAGQIDEIHAYLRQQDAISGGRSLRVDETTRSVQRASYPLRTILSCPHLLALINAPRLLDIATAYLGCKPTISAIGLHWSFPGDWPPTSVQQYHRDTEDWRFLKFFTYLTDVDLDSGPHRFILDSHRAPAGRRAAAYADAHVLARHGKDKVMTITGPRGTNFAEDTWGIHKGEQPVSRPRLMFDVMYSVRPVPIYDYRPERIGPRNACDPYINRLILADPSAPSGSA